MQRGVGEDKAERALGMQEMISYVRWKSQTAIVGSGKIFIFEQSIK